MEPIKPVYLDGDKCNGCVSCMKRCPTEAIRVRGGKATIMYERCVGCGECVKVCPTGAKKEFFDRFETVRGYKYTIALPAPSLYGQFNNLSDTDFVLTGLKRIGFDAVYEVAYAAERVSEATRQWLKKAPVKPVISSACPAVVNLILMRYEHLIDHLSPLLMPEQVAAKEALAEAFALGYKREEIGVFVIAECAAKVLQLKNQSSGIIDGVLSAKEIYFPLLAEMNKLDRPEPLKKAGSIGVSWGSSAGEAMGLQNDNYLLADGIENVVGVLNELERDKLNHIDFLELNACQSGCAGGSLNVENGFLARTRLRFLRKSTPSTVAREADLAACSVEKPYAGVNVFKLDDDRIEAMKKMIAVQEIYSKLPGINCGSCGAPTCMAFAEDVVRGLEVKCMYKAERK